MPRVLLLLPFSAALAQLAGCGMPLPLPSKDNIPFVHKIDIQQGNVITQDMLSQLEVGMERSKVHFIMGTPMVADVFHSNRWDYLYSFQEGGGRREQRRVSLFFEDDRLVRVEGDIKPALGRLEVERERSAMVEVPGEHEESMFARLKDKVWFGDDEPESAAASDAALEADRDSEDTTLEEGVASREEVVVPDDAPVRKKKGFFARLFDRVGRGEEEKARSEEPRYRDPTDPDNTDL
jgi:outer membrane protein assembly factor BamE